MLTTEQFLAIFQGLVLTGNEVLTPEYMNKVLNVFVDKMEESQGEERLSFSQTIAGIELVISYRKMLMAGSGSSVDQERNSNLIDT